MRSIDDMLKNIPWHELTTATGKATHVPNAIIGLMSEDGDIRQRSYFEIDNEVVLQSDLFESAYFVVPVLIAMLELNAPHKECIYELLREIHDGYAPDTVVRRGVDGNIKPLRTACKEQVRLGRCFYLRDSGDVDDRISSLATELLEYIDNPLHS